MTGGTQTSPSVNRVRSAPVWCKFAMLTDSQELQGWHTAARYDQAAQRSRIDRGGGLQSRQRADRPMYLCRPSAKHLAASYERDIQD